MAISTARAQINGTWHNLTKNGSTGRWEATITAPSTSSFQLSGGYYPVTVEATNLAGVKTTVTSADAAMGGSLRLVVKERVKPTISITSPATGANLGNNQTPVTFTLRDETNGSGVKLNTLSFRLDGATLTSASPGMVCTAVSGGYNCAYTPPTALSDGSHTVTINVQDNDGNVATAVAVTYTIDTIPPVLNVTSPANGLITSTAAQTVVGNTNDATSSSVTVTIRLNGADQGAVSISGGAFSKAITLAEGANTIKVTSTDRAGKSTTVTLSAVLDTGRPVFSGVTIGPNPADAGATIVLSAVVE